jgi:phosphatidylglycerol:prolipoprotein diacylglycerol transferase
MWQNFYSWHDPIIFSIGAFSLRWYGLMYVTALLVGYFWGRKMVSRGEWKPMDLARFEVLFFYFAIGAVLGARIGYALIYDNDRFYFLSHPWQVFNPFSHGSFGISGLSYHGAILGAIAALFLYSKRHKIGAFYSGIF